MKKECQVIKGFYKGYKCDSVWQLAFVIYNIDHNIRFSRNIKGFPYVWYGKTHHYFPDFVMQDGTYVEIKGYQNGKDSRKINSFPYKLKILYKNQMKPYLQYMFKRYGNDPTKIYETYVIDNFCK